MDNQKLSEQIDALRKDLEALSNEFYRGNFSARQDFNKMANFTTRLKIPHYDALPSSCEVGEIIEMGGTFYGASANNTWVIIGTQS